MIKKFFAALQRRNPFLLVIVVLLLVTGCVKRDKSIRSTAFFWTATPSGEFDAWNREISEGSQKLQRVGVAKGLGLSVRCVKDN